MIDLSANTLSVDEKPVKWMTINGRIAYSADPDSTYTAYALQADYLTRAYKSGPYTYTPPGDTSAYTYYTYQYTTPDVMNFIGNLDNVFPVSPHVWIHAKHYNRQLSSFSAWYQGQFNVVEQVQLKAWAQQQGLPLPACDIDDIEVLTTTEGVSSPLYVPYLMPYKQFQGTFHKDKAKGVPAWEPTPSGGLPTNYYPSPVIFVDDVEQKLRWSTANFINATQPSLIPESSQYDAVRNADPTYLGTTGSSGLPVYVQIGGGKMVVASHCWQIYKPAFSPTAPYYMCGPDYFKAFDLLKAYIESKGDSVKTV